LTSRAIFFTARGTIRGFWRVGLFCVAVAGCWVVAASLLSPVLVWIYRVIGLRSVSSDGWVEVAALLGGHRIALLWADKRPWSDVGLGHQAAHPRLLARGFALGALGIGIPVVCLIACGWLVRAPAVGAGLSTGPEAWAGAAVRVSTFLLPAALAEELLARGYVFTVIRDAAGWGWSLSATSIGFGLLHIANNGATEMSLALVMLAGVLLGLVRIATRSLYAAWAAHFAWNWTMAVVFHVAVSGYPLESPAYRYVDAGPNWATGGAWGPEAGIPAGLSMVVIIGYLMARQRRRQEGETWPNG